MNPSSRNPVGRPRQFDEDKVLDAVVDIFWLQGYESTSMADLLKATGLHKGSLYQAFGDKHSLFVLALQRYLDRYRQDMQAGINAAKNGLEELCAIMEISIQQGCHGAERNSGCLALNTLVDKGTQDTAILSVLQNGFDNRTRMTVAAIKRAQEEGSLRSDLSAESIATMASIMTVGVVATLRGPLTMEAARGLVDDFLLTIRPSAIPGAAENSAEHAH